MDQVEASKAWFTRRVLPLSLEQLRWRPAPRRWSIAECLDHLNITLGVYLAKIDDAIALASCGGEGPTHDEQAEIDALKQVEPPVAVPMAAPPALIPAPAVDPDNLVDCFHRSRDRYANTVRRGSGLDLPRIVLVEPVDPLIHTLGGALAFLAAHDRRHMWQAEQVRRASRFPKPYAVRFQGEECSVRER